jgi:hypothetical protein
MLAPQRSHKGLGGEQDGPLLTTSDYPTSRCLSHAGQQGGTLSVGVDFGELLARRYPCQYFDGVPPTPDFLEQEEIYKLGLVPAWQQNLGRGPEGRWLQK